VRTTVVTGSASGIGAAVRRHLEGRGERVVGVDLAGAEVEADLGSGPGRQRAVDEVRARCGGSLDGVVACAGLGPHVRERSAIVAVNHFGALAVLDGLLADLARGQAPAAVVIGSNSAGLIPLDGADAVAGALFEALLAGDEPAARVAAGRADGAVVYGLTKRALAVSVRRRAAAWGEAGVRLNAVAPGPVATPLLQGTLDDPTLGPLVDALPVPLGRRAQPDEIAALVTFLQGPDAAFVHGSGVVVDSGTEASLRPDHV
jgi:NAD(P)-dependent dehydrogenase (short-subunit alcohol dehydrogenase family)